MKTGRVAAGIRWAWVTFILVGSLTGGLAAGAGNGPPGGGKRRPPPESVGVCASKAAGDACEFTRGDGKVFKGVCAPLPDGGALHCRPDEKAPEGSAPGAPAPQP